MQNIQTKPLNSEIIKKYKIFPKVKEEPENEVTEDYEEKTPKTEFQKRLSQIWFS